MGVFRSAALVVVVAFWSNLGWELLKPLPLVTLRVCPSTQTGLAPDAQCCRIHTSPILQTQNRATEDMEIDAELNVALVSVANLRAMSMESLHGTGGIVSLDLSTGKFTELPVQGIDQQRFSPHGSSYLVTRDENGIVDARYYFVVNHAPGGVDSIMRFLVVVNQFTKVIEELQFQAEFTSQQFVALNDVAAQSKDSFFVTSQHAVRSPTLGVLLETFSTGTGSVLHYTHLTNGSSSGSSSSRVALVASSIRYANGVLLSADGRWLFVSNMLGREVLCYSVDGGDGTLVLHQRLPVGMMVDNLSLDPRDGSLWMAGSPSALDALAYAALNKTSASQVMHALVSVSDASLLVGPASTVYLDSGSELAGSSIAVVVPGKRLLVGSFGDSKLVECDLP